MIHSYTIQAVDHLNSAYQRTGLILSLLDAIEGYTELTQQEMEELDEFFSTIGEPEIIDDSFIEKMAGRGP